VPARISFQPKKSLGQNFLQDENIARKIVAAIKPQAGDVLLEIGPGEGAITKYMTGRVKKLIVVEIDSRAAGKIRESFARHDVDVLHEDILDTDFHRIAEHHHCRIRVVGNIPYNITSQIIFRVMDQRNAIEDATLMMQREVARRLVAAPRSKEYGILSVFCQLYADVKLLFDVSPHAFYPKPRITSSLVHMTLLRSPRYPLADEMFFNRMIHAVFGKRRKTLRNSLSYFMEKVPLLPSTFDLGRRPEELSIRELVDLGNGLAATL
jgi:16S rRNA (adenine1518-N6/adenine1519-N6)-dimethyltransferase